MNGEIKSALISAFALGCTMTTSVVSAAETIRNWTGLANDGLWSSPENWDPQGKPVNGETLYIDIGSADVTLENDIADLSVYRLELTATSADKKLTINGNPFAISRPSWGSLFKSSCSFVMNADVWIAVGGKMTLSGKENVFNGNISAANDIGLTMEGADNRTVKKIEFNGDVTLPGNLSELHASFAANGYGVRVDWNGKVSCANFFSSDNTKPTTSYFNASGNPIARMAFNGLDIHLVANDALSTNTVVGHKTGITGTVWSGDYYLAEGSEQTINRLTGVALSGSKLNFRAETTDGAATLVMRASDNDTTYFRINDAVSLVYDPVGDFTQTFSDRVHPTKGSIVVKGGCFQMSGACTFAAVPTIDIAAGARFSIGVTSVSALAGLRALKLGDGSRFEVSAGTPNPFPTTGLRVMMTSDSRFAIPAGVVLTGGCVFVDGVPLAAGTYTGEGGSGTVLPQIEGTGLLEVVAVSDAAYWTGAADNFWSEVSNWNGGELPSDSLPARILKHGTYSVSTVGATLPTALDVAIENDSEGHASLELSGLRVFNGAKFAIGRQSELVVAEGADVSMTGGRFSINDGGMLSVKGTLTFEDAAGLPSYAKGVIEVSGGGCLVTKAIWCDVLKSGTVRVTDDAMLYNPVSSQARYYMSPSAAGETCQLELSGRAQFKNGGSDGTGDMLVLNNGIAGGKTVVRMSGDSVAYVGKRLHVAKGNGSFAEIDLADNAYLMQRYYGIDLGTGATDPNAPARGVMRLTGGSVRTYTVDPENAGARRGVIVGDGSGTEASGYANLGELYISGGAITNGGTSYATSAMFVGVGSGKGKVVQSAGVFRNADPNPSVIGLRGGRGDYDLTGGTLETIGDLYVGGCPTNALACLYSRLPTEKPGLGFLSVGGGSVKAANLYVAKEGQGEISLNGGTVEASGSVSFCSSEVAGASYAAQVSFSVDETGKTGLITAGGACVISDAAKLVVDLGDYSGKRLTLIKAGELDGAFKPENITVRGSRAAEAILRQQGGRVTIGFPVGLMITVR